MASTALANVPLTIVSTDPYTNTNAYHQVELEPDTYSFGSTIVSVHQTSRFTDGGSDNTGWETSQDNGATWTHGFLPDTTQYSTPPGPWARISDPAVGYDAKHNVWMIAGLAIDASVTGKAVLISRSLD
ncbi:MAG TPA: exo-alpha-sialidase, partial [Actinomycetota bacterium]|nr:exo-alpha-sialidase [Actinomycetota bacterium]